MKSYFMKLHMAWAFVVIIAGSKPPTGPTVENALAADLQLAKALQNNDSAGIYHLLDKDWAVIPSTGSVLEGAGVFPSGIRTGYRTLRVMELSEPRVRLYGNIAVVTSKVRLSGQLGGKSYDDLMMRQTDIWNWKDGAWKCVLTQEALVKESAGKLTRTTSSYWFVMFDKGADWGKDSALTAKLFQEHIHYIISQRESGKIITGGAFLDKATWIGFEIYGCNTSEEVEKLIEADPAVSSKIFSCEIHPWATLKGEVIFE